MIGRFNIVHININFSPPQMDPYTPKNPMRFLIEIDNLTQNLPQKDRGPKTPQTPEAAGQLQPEASCSSPQTCAQAEVLAVRYWPSGRRANLRRAETPEADPPAPRAGCPTERSEPNSSEIPNSEGTHNTKSFWKEPHNLADRCTHVP